MDNQNLDPVRHDEKMRRETAAVLVGSVGIGGTNLVRVHSMTNTLTADARAVSCMTGDFLLMRFNKKKNASERRISRYGENSPS